MFQEQNGSQILSKHICRIVGSWYGIKFYRSILHLFTDVVIAYLNVFDTLLCDRVLRIEAPRLSP